MKWFKVYAVLALMVTTTWSSVSQADTQFRIMVDASGTMQMSDPERITPEAIRLLSDLSPEGKVSIGVWLFGEQPRVLFPESVVTPANNTKLRSHLKNYVTQDLRTDFESIFNALLTSPNTDQLKSGYRRDWIVVTDGNVNISLDDKVNQASRQRIWSDITQRLENQDIHLNTISLTGYSDDALLDHLSYRTNASHTDVVVSDNILSAFSRIYSQSVPSQELPIEKSHFQVDQAVSQISIESLHEEGQLPTIIQPDGTPLALSNRHHVSIAESKHYTIATITNPAKGQWTVNDVDPSRVTVRAISSFNVRATQIDPLVFIDEPVQSTVSLFANGRALTDSGSSTGRVSQTLSRIAGVSQDVMFTTGLKPMQKGRFINKIEGLTKPGEYQLTTQYLGDQGERQFVQYFTVQPPVSFSLQSSGANLVSFSASVTNAKLAASKSSMKLELTYGDGRKQFESMVPLKDGDWNKVVPISSDSDIQAKALLTGTTTTGQKIRYWTPKWTIHRNQSGSLTVTKGDRPSAPPPTSVVETEQNVAPVSVEPDVDVIGSMAHDTPHNDEPAKTKTLLQEAQTEANSLMNTPNLLVYLGIAGGVLILLIILRVVSRRRSRGRYDDLQGDDVDDV